VNNDVMKVKMDRKYSSKEERNSCGILKRKFFLKMSEGYIIEGDG
jgi:hypothetical protein